MKQMIRTLVVASLVSFGVTPSGLVAAAPRDQAVFRGRVLVGEDGNGVASATFPTTVAGEEVRYVMVIENGITNGGRARPPVAAMQITLNDQIVFQSRDLFLNEVVEVALNPSGAMNEMAVQATGTPGSGASVVVLAFEPTARMVGGRSILPWGWGADSPHTSLLTIHNAGSSPLAYRLAFFNPDGSMAGRSDPAVLASHGTVTLAIGVIAVSHTLKWSAGAVHVQWVSNRMTRMSTTVITMRNKPADDGAGGGNDLDDLGPFPITRQQFEDVAGMQVIPQ